MPLAHTDIWRAYERIRELIISLELAPGSPIHEQHLAERLGMEPPPVQEALRLLAHEGLVVMTPRWERGVHVSHVHLADLEQLSEVHLALESLSARLAARRATPDDLAALEALCQEEASIPPEDGRGLLDLDRRFHRALAHAAGNQYLAETLERLLGLSQRLHNIALPRLGSLAAAAGEHRDVLEAIRAGDADRAAQVMRDHVERLYHKVRSLLTARVTASYGSDVRSVVVEANSLLGGAIVAAGLPLEQPCAGRGTCGKCKVLAEGGLAPMDEVEQRHLSAAERSAGYRLACRARVMGDVSVTLAPVVVYSNKIFRTSEDYRQEGAPLGLAIDLGTTTVAAFLVTLPDGKVCAGAAALNQQTGFGADVISRMAEASKGEEQARRLSALARSSIVQAIDALRLPPQVKARVRKVTIVGNCAMHHLLLGYPVDSLVALPFQPHDKATVRQAEHLLQGVLPPGVEISLPPLIGGFVGSDALACLAYYGFDCAPGAMAAIDLGTNGEVMVTDGRRILVASTAAGPAFEGVNISCGTRAVDGAVVGVRADAADGSLALTTIGDQRPVGLTGSGLLDLVHELRRAGVIDETGRFSATHATFGPRIEQDEQGMRRFLLTDEGVDRRGYDAREEGATISLYLTQHDVRELQKAKAAVRAAAEILLGKLGRTARDLQRVILTGSFGSQLNVRAVVGLGMIPPVEEGRIEASANGAGFGAALFLDDEQFARGERIAAAAEQVDLNLEPDFNRRFIEGLAMPGPH